MTNSSCFIYFSLQIINNGTRSKSACSLFKASPIIRVLESQIIDYKRIVFSLSVTKRKGEDNKKHGRIDIRCIIQRGVGPWRQTELHSNFRLFTEDPKRVFHLLHRVVIVSNICVNIQ